MKGRRVGDFGALSEGVDTIAFSHASRTLCTWSWFEVRIKRWRQCTER